MRLDWNEDDEVFRAELVAFLDEHAPPEAPAEGFELQDIGDGRELNPQWMSDNAT